MKFIFSQMAYFVAQQSNKRNMRFMLRFFCFTLVLIGLYSVIFHYLMYLEDRPYSPVTGVYWTLTVMSTLGFGDITFNSDLGKVFSILVLLSGVLLFMLVMPFTFIRYVYSPWLDAHTKAMLPTTLPEDTSGHVILAGTDGITMALVHKLASYNIPYIILSDDYQTAMEIFDTGKHVFCGSLDSTETYERLRAGKASMVAALRDDMKNTNIAATVREVAPNVMIAACADHRDSLDILHLAGCTHTFLFSNLLGEALARRVFGSAMHSNVIGRFGSLCVAEAPAHGTLLVGKTLRQIDFRGRLGLNVIGIWQGNEFMSARPDTAIDDGAVLLLAGTADLLDIYDEQMLMRRKVEQDHRAMILGGGRVGLAVARTLEQRHIPFTLVEKDPELVPQNDPRFVPGSAADLETLRRAGIDRINSVLVTTHDDDLNIYLTIYCRKLRPDAQILSRANLDRNVASLYKAGANLVMSHSSMAANALINLLRPGRVFMLTEGLNIFRLPAPPSLLGVNLKDSGIRNLTDCNLVAMQMKGPEGSDDADEMIVNPDPGDPIQPGCDLILIGTKEAEEKFLQVFCQG